MRMTNKFKHDERRVRNRGTSSDNYTTTFKPAICETKTQGDHLLCGRFELHVPRPDDNCEAGGRPRY